MRLRLLCVGLFVAALAHDTAAAELKLEKVVLISRHGVRSPTDTHPPLSEIASRPWPEWPVPPGHLTPRGEKLAALMGSYYRQYFAARGLLPEKGCPAANDVHLWADVDQRTLRTGEGLLAGLAPGCGLAVHHAPTDKPDPIFHPVQAGVCSIDPERGRTAVLDRVGGNLDSVLRRERAAIRRLQSVMGCCSPRLCPDAAGEACRLETVSSAVEAREKGHGVGLSGPISIGSTASEIFLLEYAQGLPRRQVAWGRASPAAGFSSLLRLHRWRFELIDRTPYLAGRQGSVLLGQILDSLRSVADRSPAMEVAVPADSKVILYVGHDTNLANLGGMLGVHWRLPTYGPDETPPAGALAFELLRDTASGAHFVRMRYFSQTLDQMRRMTPLGRQNPPAEARITLPGCTAGPGRTCSWSEFEARAKNALDADCVATKMR